MQVGMEILRTLDPLLFFSGVPIDSWDRYGKKVKKKEKSKTIHSNKSFPKKGLLNATKLYHIIRSLSKVSHSLTGCPRKFWNDSE